MSDEQAQGYIDHLHDIHESAKFDKEMTALDVFKKSTKELSRAISEQGMTEFNLSEKIMLMNLNPVIHGIDPEDVKEFIRLLKEGFKHFPQIDRNQINDFIDKLAGEKLDSSNAKGVQK